MLPSLSCSKACIYALGFCCRYSTLIHVLKNSIAGSINFGSRSQTPDGLRGMLRTILQLLRVLEEMARTEDDPYVT
jgi:hypothetical protein